MGAANPYRFLQEADKEAAVGLAFRFAQTTQDGNGASACTTGQVQPVQLFRWFCQSPLGKNCHKLIWQKHLI
jgi:hypothetical protein